MENKLIVSFIHEKLNEKSNPELLFKMLQSDKLQFLKNYGALMDLKILKLFKDESNSIILSYYYKFKSELLEKTKKRNTNDPQNTMSFVQKKQFNYFYFCKYLKNDKIGYMSEKSLSEKYPALYYQYIGKYRKDSEIKEKQNQIQERLNNTTIDKKEPLLSEFLLKIYDNQRTVEKMMEELEDQDENLEEMEDTTTDLLKRNEISFEEIQLFREEFYSLVEKMFVSGEDSNFDYNLVYSDKEIQNQVDRIQGFDEEEKYFDD